MFYHDELLTRMRLTQIKKTLAKLALPDLENMDKRQRTRESNTEVAPIHELERQDAQLYDLWFLHCATQGTARPGVPQPQIPSSCRLKHVAEDTVLDSAKLWSLVAYASFLHILVADVVIGYISKGCQPNARSAAASGPGDPSQSRPVPCLVVVSTCGAYPNQLQTTGPDLPQPENLSNTEFSSARPRNLTMNLTYPATQAFVFRSLSCSSPSFVRLEGL